MHTDQNSFAQKGASKKIEKQKKDYMVIVYHKVISPKDIPSTHLHKKFIIEVAQSKLYSCTNKLAELHTMTKNASK